MWINIKNSEIQNDKQRICKIHVGLFRDVLICTLQVVFLTVIADIMKCLVLIFHVDHLQNYWLNVTYKPSARRNNSVYSKNKH